MYLADFTTADFNILMMVFAFVFVKLADVPVNKEWWRNVQRHTLEAWRFLYIPPVIVFDGIDMAIDALQVYIIFTLETSKAVTRKYYHILLVLFFVVIVGNKAWKWLLYKAGMAVFSSILCACIILLTFPMIVLMYIDHDYLLASLYIVVALWWSLHFVISCVSTWAHAEKKQRKKNSVPLMSMERAR